MGPLWMLVFCVTILMGMLTLSVMREEREAIAKQNESAKSRISNTQEQDDDIFEDDLGGSSPRIVTDMADMNCNNEAKKPYNGTVTNYSDNIDMMGERSNRNDPTPTPYRQETFNLERTKILFRQASLYVGVFYISWLIPSIASIIRIGVQKMDKPPYGVLVLVCIFEPMQGFLNCLGERMRDYFLFLSHIIMVPYGFSLSHNSVSILPYDGVTLQGTKQVSLNKSYQ